MEFYKQPISNALSASLNDANLNQLKEKISSDKVLSINEDERFQKDSQPEDIIGGLLSKVQMERWLTEQRQQDYDETNEKR